jgi:hypothetical protein
VDGVDLLAIKENTLGKRSLARVDMGGNTDVPHLFNVYGHLEPSPHRNRMTGTLWRRFCTPAFSGSAGYHAWENVEKIAVYSRLLEK